MRRDHSSVPYGAPLDLAFKVTGKVQNSFISKYLHFHFPHVVPIFENYAYNAAWELAQPPASEVGLYDGRRNRDYGYSCGAILGIMVLLQQRGVKSRELKLFDVVLYGSRQSGTPEAEGASDAGS